MFGGLQHHRCVASWLYRHRKTWNMTYLHHISLRFDWCSFGHVIFLRHFLLQWFNGTCLEKYPQFFWTLVDGSTHFICQFTQYSVNNCTFELNTALGFFLLDLIILVSTIELIGFTQDLSGWMTHLKHFLSTLYVWCTEYSISTILYPFSPSFICFIYFFSSFFHLENNIQTAKSQPATTVSASVCCSHNALSVKWIPPVCLQQHFTITRRALCEVETTAAWLAPHFHRLMEGGGPLGERNHADALSEWQACYIFRDSPLALTIIFWSIVEVVDLFKVPLCCCCQQ